jgi:hypothetical protein
MRAQVWRCKLALNPAIINIYFADAGEHVDGGPEVANVKNGKGELDVAIVTNTFRRFLSTSQAFCTLLIRPLAVL